MARRYRVAENTKVTHEGRTYASGEVLMLEPDTAKPWVDANVIRPLPVQAERED